MQIAQTVEAIAFGANPLVPQILNRSVPLKSELIDIVKSQTQFTWHGRNPKAARDAAGNPRPTNLDFLSVMVELCRRGSNMSLSEYKNKFPWQVWSHEQHVGGTERFGKIVGLVSHREHLSFSVELKDDSVYNTEVGKPHQGSTRRYMIVDHNGEWYEYWKGFDWDKTSEELAYLNRRDLLVDDRVQFEDYVHTNRRQSIFGAPYLLLKLLLLRIEDELTFRRSERTRIEKEGNFKPIRKQRQNVSLATGPTRSVPAITFAVTLTGLSVYGEYSPIAVTYQSYVENEKQIELLKQYRSFVQFIVRADEVAFYRFGLERNYVAPWIKGTTWQPGAVGAASIALGDTLSLSYRVGEKELRVAA